MSSDFSSTRFTQDPESGNIGVVAPFLSLAHRLGVGPYIPTFATKFEVIAFTVWSCFFRLGTGFCYCIYSWSPLGYWSCTIVAWVIPTDLLSMAPFFTEITLLTGLNGVKSTVTLLASCLSLLSFLFLAGE